MATIKAGTYRFNDVLSVPDSPVYVIGSFTSDAVEYTAIAFAEPDVEGSDEWYLRYALDATLFDSIDAYSTHTGWADEGYKTITIPKDTEVSDEFSVWFTENTVEQKQISGKWRFNDVLSVPSEDLEQEISFVTSLDFTALGRSLYSVTCNKICFDVDTEYDYLLYYPISYEPNDGGLDGFVGSELTAYDARETVQGTHWPGFDEIKTIDFGTTPQYVSSEFYEWFIVNAKPVVEETPTVTITYNGSAITNLFAGQKKATLKCAGKTMETDVVVEVAEGGGTTGGDGGTTDEGWIGDGNTHIWIELHEGRTSPMLGVCPNGTVTVDWGDGTTPDVLTGTSVSTVKWTPTHNYAQPGKYVITLTVDGEMRLGTYGCIRHSSNLDDNRNKVYSSAIRRVEIGSGITSIGDSAFGACFGLASVNIHDGVTSIGSMAFSSCHTLASINIPDGVTSIENGVFRNCYGVRYYDFTASTSVPTLASTNAFSGIAADCEILVPAALYDEWIAATNWTTYASYIKAV